MPTAPEMTPLQQAVSSNNAQAFARFQDMILTEAWEMNRWLLASLLAINSAAGAAVYSAQEIAMQAKQVPCWLFVLGALAALASGFSQSLYLVGLDRPVTDAQHYWSAVSGGAQRSHEAEKKYELEVISKNRLSLLPSAFQVVAVILFVFGIFQL